MQGLFRYVLVATPLCMLVFLLLSGFFTSWDGRVISHRPSTSPDPATYRVLIVDEAGDAVEQDWPADVVRPLDLAVDPTGIPPRTLPDDTPVTAKLPYNLFFTVTPPASETRVVRTTSARSFSGAVLLWVLGLFLYNMWRSGSPFSSESREHRLPSSQNAAGQPAPPTQAGRSKQGPPPPKRRRGQGRRR